MDKSDNGFRFSLVLFVHRPWRQVATSVSAYVISFFLLVQLHNLPEPADAIVNRLMGLVALALALILFLSLMSMMMAALYQLSHRKFVWGLINLLAAGIAIAPLLSLRV